MKTAEIRPYTRFEGLCDRVRDWHRRVVGDPPVPTLLHLTHAKAGSTWIVHLLGCLFGRRCAPRGKSVADDIGGDLARYVFAPGRVYRGMFMRREDVLAHPELAGAHRFFIQRDLRDTLVSLYFSLKITHPVLQPGVEEQRRTLLGLDEETGLLHLIHDQLGGIALTQNSWVGHDEIVLRYEDLLCDPLGTLAPVFLDRWQLPVPRTALDRAIRRTHFQTVYRRRLGEEDRASHGRTGLPGNWRRHFTPEVRRQFAARFASTLVATGYEPDDRWATAASSSTHA